jgi:hypothetical protein
MPWDAGTPSNSTPRTCHLGGHPYKCTIWAQPWLTSVIKKVPVCSTCQDAVLFGAVLNYIRRFLDTLGDISILVDFYLRPDSEAITEGLGVNWEWYLTCDMRIRLRESVHTCCGRPMSAWKSREKKGGKRVARPA